MTELTITRPDDWHVHLRDGDALRATVTDMARYFGRAIVMPNLLPPVMNCDQAAAYRQRIMAAQAHCQRQFEPLMVLYLTDSTSVKEIRRARAAGIVAAKLYPAGATTNSDSGVTDIKKIYPVLAAMQDEGLHLLLHGEVTDSHIDIFDREQVFIERILAPLCQDFPALKIVLEHITTRDAVTFVSEGPATLAATITAHHLLFNRNDMLAGGIRPHFYCLPILKRNIHQQALLKAAKDDVEKNQKQSGETGTAIEQEKRNGPTGTFSAFAAGIVGGGPNRLEKINADQLEQLKRIQTNTRGGGARFA